MRLYTYYRSSAAYRVRLALALKGLSAQPQFIHLLRNGGEQNSAAYHAVNPQGLLPSLETDDGAVLTQSLAIIEYLEETHPTPPLLPAGPVDRARVRAAALIIACETHPYINLRTQAYLRGPLGVDDAKVGEWVRHWISSGLASMEALVAPHAGTYCFGDTPGLADVVLMPQMFGARRFNADLSGCPTLVAIDERLRALPILQPAAPENQPDAE